MDVFNYLDTETALSDNGTTERENFSIFVKETQKVIVQLINSFTLTNMCRNTFFVVIVVINRQVTERTIRN